jgi:uncharacterized membrane protein YphA (DoxX/SURF4 family)
MSGSRALTWWKSPFLALAFRLFLGGIFLYAGISKALDPSGFAQTIHNYRILPGWLINPTAILLPWVELIVGVSLLLGIWLPGGSLLASSLLAVFSTALVMNISRGLNIDCGCFSTTAARSGNSLWYLVRDLTLLSMGIHLLFFDREFISLGRLMQERLRR